MYVVSYNGKRKSFMTKYSARLFCAKHNLVTYTIEWVPATK